MSIKGKEEALFQLLRQGLERATSSFSTFIGKRIELGDVLHVDCVNYQFSVDGLSTTSKCILTPVIGTCRGFSYLIIDESVKTEICLTVRLPKENLKMEDGFFMELDNILSASVISEIANYIKVEMYGDVPLILKSDYKDLNELVQQTKLNLKIKSDYTFLAQLRINQFCMPFIWSFENSILEFLPE